MQSANADPSLFRPSRVVTLLTDFGVSEPYVGIMKGVILSRSPTARLIDLSHQVPPFQSALAGFWLARCWKYFPVGTVHLAVVDPGVGTERKMVVLEVGGHAFVAPDNGLLDAVFHSAPGGRYRAFQTDDVRHLLPVGISNTFHGRDIFAPLVAEIIEGRQSVGELGKPKSAPTASPVSPLGSGRIVGIDHFGNLISDIPAEALAGLNCPMVQFRDLRIPLHTSYGHAPQGSLLALINSWGTVEIAEAQGNAQRSLRAAPGEGVAVIDTGDKPS
jgi:S-adenosylmethionine hydrolase